MRCPAWLALVVLLAASPAAADELRAYRIGPGKYGLVSTWPGASETAAPAAQVCFFAERPDLPEQLLGCAQQPIGVAPDRTFPLAGERRTLARPGVSEVAAIVVDLAAGQRFTLRAYAESAEQVRGDTSLDLYVVDLRKPGRPELQLLEQLQGQLQGAREDLAAAEETAAELRRRLEIAVEGEADPTHLGR